MNDIQAHQNSVDTLNDAGLQIIQQGKGTDEASTTQDKLQLLNRKWRELQQKAKDRQHELEEALREAQRYISCKELMNSFSTCMCLYFFLL